MKNTFKIILSFCSGGIIGGSFIYFVLNKKFNERIDFEVKSLKEKYLPKGTKKINKKNQSDKKKNNEKKDSTIKIDYSKCYPDNQTSTKELKPEQNSCKTPVVISPEEFEVEEDYTTIYLTYYADKILADEMDNPVQINSTIGEDALNHFGEFEDDILHVRDDKCKIYYEITKDPRTYVSVVGYDTSNNEEG